MTIDVLPRKKSPSCGTCRYRICLRYSVAYTCAQTGKTRYAARGQYFCNYDKALSNKAVKEDIKKKLINEELQDIFQEEPYTLGEKAATALQIEPNEYVNNAFRAINAEIDTEYCDHYKPDYMAEEGE